MIDWELDPAGISIYGGLPYDDTENDKYVYIQGHMLYELVGFIANKNEKEFLMALVEYLTDERELYRETAMDLLETQFERYKSEVGELLTLV